MDKLTKKEMMDFYRQKKSKFIFSSENKSDMLLEFATSMGYKFNFVDEYWEKVEETDFLPFTKNFSPSTHFTSKTVTELYGKEKTPAIKTVVEFYSPFLDQEKLNEIRFGVFSGHSNAILEPIINKVIEDIGDTFECDIKKVTCSLVNLISPVKDNNQTAKHIL